MQDRRALLLVDQRGTGLSDPFLCPAAQVYDGNWIANAEACGVQLGQRSDLYTSAAAAHDLKAVLDSIGVTQIDLYGDSYGSFFSQAFAVRYPAILRTLVLDATYPISDLDPLYRTSATRLRENLALFCARSVATCPTTPGDMVGLVDRVLARIRANPVSTTAPDGTGRETTVIFTPRRVLDALLYTDGTPGWIREAPAALAAFLGGNQRPLGRMVAESAIDPATAGAPRRPGGLRPRAEIRSFSEGAYLAYACTDYPAIWTKQASFSARESQYAATLAALPASTFAPWRTADYADSDFFVYEYCLHWPAPGVPEPPFPAGGRYPNVPTLVLNGDLDIRTDVYQARAVARNFPRSTYLEVPNIGHVTALYDADACAAGIVRRFVESISTGDTSCLYTHPGAPPRPALRGTGRRCTGSGASLRSRPLDRRRPARSVGRGRDARGRRRPLVRDSRLHRIRLVRREVHDDVDRRAPVHLARLEPQAQPDEVDDGHRRDRDGVRASCGRNGERLACDRRPRDGEGRSHGQLVDACATGAGADHRNDRWPRDRSDAPRAVTLVSRRALDR